MTNPTLLFRCRGFSLDRPALREFTARLQHQVAGGRPFDCLLTRDAELQRLNREFRDKDQATDVLSFPSGGREGFLGEIAISVDRAAAQAEEFGHEPEEEIRILMLHGVLHLLGMDHERDGGRMRRAEKRWRKLLGLPTGLIERVHQ